MIQYHFEMENEPVNPPHNLMQEKNSSMMLKKLAMHNNAESEQRLAVTSAKRVAIFQASLKLVKEEAGAQIFKTDNKGSTSQGSKHLHDWECCTYKLCINYEMMRWPEALWWWWGSKEDEKTKL